MVEYENTPMFGGMGVFFSDLPLEFRSASYIIYLL